MSMGIKRYALVCILSLLQCLPAMAAPASQVAKSLQQKYDAVTSMKASFTQVLLHKESGAREQRSGTLLFKKPLLLRWENTKPGPELLLVTGREIWNVFPDEEIAYKYPLSLAQDSRSIVRVVTGQARLDQDFQIEQELREGNLVRLHLFPKEPVQALVEAFVWVDPTSHLIKKVRIYDFYGNQNEIAFTSQSIDAPVHNGTFSFTPPKGMDVEDRSKEGAGPQRGLLR